MKLGQRIAKLVDSDRVYEKKADGTEVFNREKTIAKNAERHGVEHNAAVETAFTAAAVTLVGTTVGAGTLIFATATPAALGNGPPELGSLGTILAAVAILPAVGTLGLAAYQGLLSAKDSVDHAWNAHQLARDSVHTP